MDPRRNFVPQNLNERFVDTLLELDSDETQPASQDIPQRNEYVPYTEFAPMSTPHYTPSQNVHPSFEPHHSQHAHYSQVSPSLRPNRTPTPHYSHPSSSSHPAHYSQPAFHPHTSQHGPTMEPSPSSHPSQHVHSSQSRAPVDPAPSTSGRAPVRRKRVTSDVWKIFIKINETNEAQCSLCSLKLKAKGKDGTTSLRRHLDKEHIDWNILPQAEQHGTLYDAYHGIVGPGYNFKFDPSTSRKALAGLICCLELPFSIVENPRFNNYIRQFVQPLWEETTGKTIVSDLHKIYKDKKYQLIEQFLDFNGRLSFTSDIWSSPNCLSFLCLTSHWIDDDWVLQKRMLGFKVLEQNHTGDLIYRTIIETINDYGLGAKVMSITLDNASNNLTAVRSLLTHFGPLPMEGVMFHVRCAAHIINLCVQDGLTYISPQLKKIRDVITLIKSSTVKRGEWRKMCRENGREYRKFSIDVSHRWNSTYLLLRATNPYQALLSEFVRINLLGYEITQYDWELANGLMELLGVFYNATLQVSHVYTPTAHKLIPEIYNLGEALATATQSIGTPVGQMALRMKQKFKKYWERLPVNACFALLLDPRIRMLGLRGLVGKIYEFLGIDHQELEAHVEIQAQSQNEIHPEPLQRTANQFLDSVEVEFESTYLKYHNRHFQNSPQVISPQQTHASNAMRYVSSLAGGARGTTSTSNRRTFLSLNSYLNYDHQLPHEGELDILKWWQTTGQQFPALRDMARDFLAIQMSSVASEQAFSAGKRMISDRRANLTADTIETAILYKDWADAETRIQWQPIFIDDYSEEWEDIVRDERQRNAEAQVEDLNM